MPYDTCRLKVPRQLGYLLALALTASCAAAPAALALQRARGTIEELAGKIGSRPIGSSEARRARDYVASELALDGLTVRIQDVDASAPGAGLTAPVSNIIATRDGETDDAIALVSHYDSVPDGPGAQDDALGVATCLEAARELVTGKPLHHSLVVIVTDGEEVGLMGARGVITDADVRARVRAFLNFDGTGGQGPPVLFEAGPGRGETLAAWARGAAAPFGTSLGVEIYKRLPNDTDFTVLAAAGKSGLNFAPVGNSYVYHTDRDKPAGVADSTLAQEITNTVGIVRALDAGSLDRTDDRPTFFDLRQHAGVVYGSTTTRAIGIFACVAGLIAWWLLTRALAPAGWRLIGAAAFRAFVTFVFAVAAMTAEVWVLRVARHESAPWYAAPFWTFGALTATGLFTIWAVNRRRWLASPDADGSRAPLLTWWCGLPVWIAFGAFLLTQAPGASYLIAFPLLAASVSVLISRRSTWLRAASALVAVVVVTLWAADLVVLLGFLVPLFGWLPVLTPAWLYPAVIAIGGVMILPPLLGLASGTAAARRLSGGAGVAGAVIAIGLIGRALAAPVYTDDRPARRSVRYLEDEGRHQAWWSVAGSDGRIEDGAPPAAGASWTRATGPMAVSPVTVAGLNLPIEVRAHVAPVTSGPPADVSATSSREADRRVTLQVMVTPHALLAAQIVLPKGLTPVTSNYPGVLRHEQWTAGYVAVPQEDFAFHMHFDASVPTSALHGTALVLTVAGVPGADGAISKALPSWLPQGPATWQARSTFIVLIQPEDQ